MLISRKYKFIFIHIPKTAGQSITKALSPFATGNFQGKLSNLLCSKNLVSRSVLNRLHIYHPHITAEELITVLGEETFNDYFSFAIVRNPWEWQVSLYNYALKNPRHKNHQFIKSLGTFEQYIQFLSNQPDKSTFLQHPFIFNDKEEKLVNYIGKYEQLSQDFKIICAHLGISAKLPRLNVYRTKDYKKYYNEEMIEIVRQKFASDIEAFKYSF